MKTSISSIALATIGLGSLAVAVPMSVARAQDRPADTTQQRDRGATPPPAQPGQTFGSPGQAGPNQFNPGGGFAPGAPGSGMAAQMRGMGGGNATMVADNNSLYILMGNRIFQVSKADLRVLREGMLPVGGPQPGMDAPRFDAAPGGGAAGPRRGGGGGGTQGGGDKAK